MGYEALLFCPDEKTARTVTQVLSELEFSVEACMEPFAAVKKLMGQHFDAVVVDCDNEQNATLLFKSARNSTSNQASLAVAVVEGQAGVAKAFRIGANLVLTKPINIEQAKGTLRVARGLLRKGEPGKPAVAAPAVAPAKPAAVKPVPPAKPAVPATLAAAMAPRPAAPAVATSPAATSEVKAAWPAPAAAAAKSVSAAQDDDLLDIGDDSVAAPAAAAPIVLASGGANPAVTTAADVRAAFHPGVTGLHGSGAASAAAPAREAQDSHVAEKPTGGSAAAANALFEKPAEAAQSASHIGAEPTFTFGGSNLPEKSSGASKKMLLGVAAAAIVVAGLYFGWSQFKGRTSEPTNPSTPTPVTSAPATSAPVTPAPIKKPSGAQPAAPAVSAPKPTSSAISPISQPDAIPTSTQKGTTDDTDAASDDAASAAPSSTKHSTSTSSAADKPAEEVKPEAAPLVVKGGSAAAAHKTSSAADAPAPSMMGIAATGAGAPPPDLVSGAGSAPKPILQTLNVSQGVSRGLLMKKVQPAYPTSALTMRIEGAVELQATISKTGDITHVKALSGNPQLTKAATDAVKQWKYKPYLLNGEPVEIQTEITVNFKLPQ